MLPGWCLGPRLGPSLMFAQLTREMLRIRKLFESKQTCCNFLFEIFCSELSIFKLSHTYSNTPSNLNGNIAMFVNIKIWYFLPIFFSILQQLVFFYECTLWVTYKFRICGSSLIRWGKHSCHFLWYSIFSYLALILLHA